MYTRGNHPNSRRNLLKDGEGGFAYELGRGRSPLHPSNRKCLVTTVRFSPLQAEILVKEAERREMPVTTMIRELALERLGYVDL